MLREALQEALERHGEDAVASEAVAKSEITKRPSRVSISPTMREVLEIVRELGPIAARDVVAMIPHVKEGTVHAALHTLKIAGEVVVHDKVPLRFNNKFGDCERPMSRFTINPDPNKTPQVVAGKRRAKDQPTQTGVVWRLEQEVTTLRARITELTAWQERALARHPDLAVSEAILKARVLVAEECRSTGDENMAQQVMAGFKDTILPMRVAIRMFEEQGL